MPQQAATPLPFPIGQTYFGRGTANANDGKDVEGSMYWVEDIDYNATTNGGPYPKRSNRIRCVMVVRNTSAGAILGKQLVIPELDGLEQLGRVNGYSTTAGQRAFPADEFLPSDGVAVNDLFYVVISGPAMLSTPTVAADYNGDIAEGALLASAVGGTSGATTSGKVANVTITNDTTTLNAAVNKIGRALSAVSSQSAAQDILVDVQVLA